MTREEDIQFSIIIPVYNRPQEVRELLESLAGQTYKNFEVIIIEDGSAVTCEHEISRFKDKLNIKYFYKENSGSSVSRNFGVDHASGNYILFFDSDCIIPENYIEIVLKKLKKRNILFFGGPDAAHPSFSTLQKAIDYAMTSFITTGGIRGGKRRAGTFFYPRSCNMGIEKNIFLKIRGFNEKLRYGEDVDLGLRLKNLGIKAELYTEAYVFHKRRSTLKKFFRQIFNFGKARVILAALHPESLKTIHTLPSIFTIGILFCIVSGFLITPIFFIPSAFFAVLFFIGAFSKYRQLKVAVWAILTAFTQLFGYGVGFMYAFWKTKILKKAAL